MQSLHGLFNRSIIVESMTLEKIDILESQAIEGSLDGREDTFARKTSVVIQSCRSAIFGFPIGVVGLSHDDYGLSRDLVLLEEFTEDDLGFSRRVDIGSVKGLVVSRHIMGDLR